MRWSTPRTTPPRRVDRICVVTLAVYRPLSRVLIRDGVLRLVKRKAASLVSTARFARQARIETVAHMASAQSARSWQVTRLTKAHQVLTVRFGGDEAAATGSLLAGMGYGPPFPAAWSAVADLMVSDEARYLADADLYVLTPSMCDVVVAAAAALVPEDLKLSRPEDLPSPTGLVLLPHPLLLRTIGGDLIDDRAYHWRTPAQIPRSPTRKTAIPACRVATYSDTHGPVQPDSFRQFCDAARRDGEPLPPLLLNDVRCMPFGVGDSRKELDTLREAARHVEDASREHAAAHGQDENRVFGDYTPNSIIDDDDTFAVRFLYAFWRLCEQRIGDVVAVENYPTDVRAAERAGVAPDVRVVQLRRAESSRDGAGGDRNWNHRWVVRMHKVRQWYPSEGRHKVIYRGPYVKGPADKPLIGGTTVRGLVR